MILEVVSSIATFCYPNSSSCNVYPSFLDFSLSQLLASFVRKPRWMHNNKADLLAVQSLQSMVCYTFFMGHTANYAIEMDQVLTKVSSWTQKCVDFSGIFISEIGPKLKELFQLFEGPGEVKYISPQT